MDYPPASALVAGVEDMIVGVWEKASHWCLGSSGLHPRNWQSRYFEIGYWLRASATGQGYMTETVHLLTEYAFNQLSATRLEIRCDERNGPSAAIARRLGFVQEACLRHERMAADGAWHNTLIFALLPTDRA